ncbi:hypothetical protein PO909_014594 [Leuciscus waleckii]
MQSMNRRIQNLDFEITKLTWFHWMTHRWPNPLDFSATTVTRIKRIKGKFFRKLLKFVSQQNIYKTYVVCSSQIDFPIKSNKSILRNF